MIELTWAGETFRLLPQRAAFWRERGMLLIADPHFGKADHFRASGVPVPSGTTAAALSRLNAALDTTGAAELVVLGDLFHAQKGVTGNLLDALGRWRDGRSRLRVTLVAGNHDRHAGAPPEGLGFIAAGEERAVDGLVLKHHPETVPGRAVVCGHVHPAVQLRNRTGAGMRLPCFHFGRDLAILPAFGDFTGMHAVRSKRGDRVFAVGPGKVIEVTAAKACGSRGSANRVQPSEVSGDDAD